jgi:hypothetical protein
MQRDAHGRRLWTSQAKAFRAQKTAQDQYGICTGVVMTGGLYYLRFDPMSDEIIQ